MKGGYQFSHKDCIMIIKDMNTQNEYYYHWHQPDISYKMDTHGNKSEIDLKLFEHIYNVYDIDHKGTYRSFHMIIQPFLDQNL